MAVFITSRLRGNSPGFDSALPGGEAGAGVPVVGWLGGKLVEGVRRAPPAPTPYAAPQPKILFAKPEDAERLSARSMDIIRANMAAHGISQLRITSTQRDAEGQARAMYGNLVRQGERSQRDLYDRNGNAVLDAALAARRAGLSEEAAIAAMAKSIRGIRASDPTAFKHMHDPSLLQAIDIAERGLLGSGSPAARRDRLLSGFRGDRRISKVLGHSQGDPVIHIEIPQE